MKCPANGCSRAEACANFGMCRQLAVCPQEIKVTPEFRSLVPSGPSTKLEPFIVDGRFQNWEPKGTENQNVRMAP